MLSAALSVLVALGATALPACFNDSCFAAGTLIDTPQGPVAIESLVAGDLVYAYDFELRERVPARVRTTFVHEDETVRSLTLADGRQVQVTGNHPFWAGGDWVAAEDLVDGAELMIADGTGAAPALFESYANEESGVTVYNIEVEGHHNYFAGGVLVHNKSPASVDRDGDGYFDYEDCDDNDPEITTECRDAGADSGPSDSGADSGPSDSGADSGPSDSGAADAGDAAADAGDAAADAGDAVTDAAAADAG